MIQPRLSDNRAQIDAQHLAGAAARAAEGRRIPRCAIAALGQTA